MDIYDDKLTCMLESHSNVTLRCMIENIVTGNMEGYKALVDRAVERKAVKPELNISWLPPIKMGLPSGIATKRIGLTSKVKMQAMHRDTACAQFHLSEKSLDVPLSWFSREKITAISNQIVFKEPMITAVVEGEDIVEWVKIEGLSSSDFLIKMLMMCRDSATREFWNARLETLVRMPHYRINCACVSPADANHPSWSTIYVPTEFHEFGIKEEHAMGGKGFYKVADESSVFTYYGDDDLMYSFEDPKKAFARVSRLVETNDSVSIGTYPVFIATDIPDVVIDTHGFNCPESNKALNYNQTLKDWFVSGSGYVPNSLLKQLGVMRITNKYGVKLTTMPMPISCSEQDMVILSKASFKGGIIGAYNAANPDATAELIMELHDENGNNDERNLLEILSRYKKTINFMGHEIHGYVIDMNLMASHFYALHGLRTVTSTLIEDEEEIQEVVNDDEYISNESYYLWAREEIRKSCNLSYGPTKPFNLIHDIKAKLLAANSGKDGLKYAKSSLNLKTQEFSVAHWSYGKETGKKWMHNVLDAAKSNLRGNTIESLDYHTSNTQYEIYDAQQMWDYIILDVFKGVKTINTGVLDPSSFANAKKMVKPISTEEYIGRIDRLLNGVYDDNGNCYWSGLLSAAPKIIKIKGRDFYIPSGHTMKEYIHKEDGIVAIAEVLNKETNMLESVDVHRTFLSGPAAAFLMLIVAIKSDGKKYGVNWQIKSLTHKADMQKDLLGSTVDNFTVNGGHFLMLPAPWLHSNEVVVLRDKSRGWNLDNGDKVSFSKMPVLFDKAVTSMIVRTGVNKKVFGIMDDDMRFALRNAAFCNINIMIDHQNDTDGDMCRIGTVAKDLPLYTGLPNYMSTWRNNYADDEYNLELTYKPYQAYTKDDINNAVEEAVSAKEAVGPYTNALGFLAHALETEQELPFQWKALLRNVDAMGLQDYEIRGMKHKKEDKIDFRSLTVSNLFYNVNPERTQYARDQLRQLVIQITDDIDADQIHSALSMFFKNWDVNALANEENGSPLASRRVFTIGNTSLDTCPVEDSIKQLDSVTRSYLSGVNESKPTMSTGSLNNPQDIVTKHAQIIEQEELYLEKYILSGQNLATLGTHDTVIKNVYSHWSQISTSTYDIKIISKTSNSGEYSVQHNSAVG